MSSMYLSPSRVKNTQATKNPPPPPNKPAPTVERQRAPRVTQSRAGVDKSGLVPSGASNKCRNKVQKRARQRRRVRPVRPPIANCLDDEFGKNPPPVQNRPSFTSCLQDGIANKPGSNTHQSIKHIKECTKLTRSRFVRPPLTHCLFDRPLTPEAPAARPFRMLHLKIISGQPKAAIAWLELDLPSPRPPPNPTSEREGASATGGPHSAITPHPTILGGRLGRPKHLQRL
jgi:hypothetical protein